MIKPATIAGTMELLPAKQLAFNKMLATIEKCYKDFGYTPLETPLLEKSEVLLTKSGGETEKQIYFAVPTGSLGSITADSIPKYALRFDLTVPLARYVAQHENDLTFPFKRYQIQRVYRGESAQKGRYREFYQCDADIIGNGSLPMGYDAELVVLIYRIFMALNVGKFTIQINNRKLFQGLFQDLKIDQSLTLLVLREIDKLDKVGKEKVLSKLESFLNKEQIETIFSFLALQDSAHPLEDLLDFAQGNDLFFQGKQELEQVWQILDCYGLDPQNVKFNPCIARGLDYYTSTVLETFLDEHPQIGSICSGGRYESLATHYTKSNLPGVGVSIGVTRLFYLLDSLGLLKETQSTPATAMIACLEQELTPTYIQLSKQLLKNGVSNFIYWQPSKLKKQLRYASKLGVRFLLIVGEEEQKSQTITLKNMITGEQENASIAEIFSKLC